MASNRPARLPKFTERKHRYEPLPPFMDREYKVAHGVSIQLRVFPAFGAKIKAGDSTSPAPWLLWFHGGGFYLGHHVAPYPWVLPAFHSKGYHVVSASYRLAPHASLRDILEDNADALAYCIANLENILQGMAAEMGIRHQAKLVDIDSYALGGDSAGGILALLGGFLLSPRPKAIIESCCVTDMLGYHPDPPSHYPLTEEYPTEEIHAAIAERDPARASVASPYMAELPPPLGIGRLPRGYLDTIWGPSTARFDGPSGPEPDFTTEEMRWTAKRNDMQNTSLRDCLTLPTIYRREKFDTEEAYIEDIKSLSPLHMLGAPGTPALPYAREYPATYIMHGTVDVGVPVYHARDFVARLRELGRPVDVHYAVGKNHAFDIWFAPGKPGWEVVTKGVDFVDRHVRGPREAKL